MFVEKFLYNGFSVEAPRGGWGQFENYTATFVKWTSDPGVALCECSDGKQRLIPSCCLHGPGKDELPVNDYREGKVVFGTPSES